MVKIHLYLQVPGYERSSEVYLLIEYYNTIVLLIQFEYMNLNYYIYIHKCLSMVYKYLHILKLYYVYYISPITDCWRHSTWDTFRFCLVSRHFCTREFSSTFVGLRFVFVTQQDFQDASVRFCYFYSICRALYVTYI